MVEPRKRPGDLPGTGLENTKVREYGNTRMRTMDTVRPKESKSTGGALALPLNEVRLSVLEFSNIGHSKIMIPRRDRDYCIPFILVTRKPIEITYSLISRPRNIDSKVVSNTLQ